MPILLTLQSILNPTMDNIVSNIKLKGDKAIEQIPAIKDKALRINLNDNIY
jgi:hypothetical protein